MITRFGKELRKIRIDHGEILKDMAEKLQVTPSFLSSVEVGKKNVPVGWVDKIASMYNLTAKERDFLEELSEEAVTGLKMDLRNSTQPQRQAALVFARDFGTLTDDEANRIIKLLSKKNYKEGSDAT